MTEYFLSIKISKGIPSVLNFLLFPIKIKKNLPSEINKKKKTSV